MFCCVLICFVLFLVPCPACRQRRNFGVTDATEVTRLRNSRVHTYPCILDRYPTCISPLFDEGRASGAGADERASLVFDPVTCPRLVRACPPLSPGHVPRSVSMLVVEALRLRVQPSQDAEHTPVRSRAFEMSARERCSGGCMWRGQAGAGGGGDGTPSPTRFRSKGSLEGGCPIFKTSGVFGQERCCCESRRFPPAVDLI